MSSDEAMTRLAFAGCACHYTHRIGETWHPGQGIPDEKFLANTVYVNDMIGLASFRVRKPFERYGAAAYFDKDFRIIAIYWSPRSRLIKKKVNNFGISQRLLVDHTKICDKLFFLINYNLSIENDNLPQYIDIIEFINEICK
jgi:hypothetical protein